MSHIPRPDPTTRPTSVTGLTRSELGAQLRELDHPGRRALPIGRIIQWRWNRAQRRGERGREAAHLALWCLTGSVLVVALGIALSHVHGTARLALVAAVGAPVIVTGLIMCDTSTQLRSELGATLVVRVLRDTVELSDFTRAFSSDPDTDQALSNDAQQLALSVLAVLRGHTVVATSAHPDLDAHYRQAGFTETGTLRQVSLASAIISSVRRRPVLLRSPTSP